VIFIFLAAAAGASFFFAGTVISVFCPGLDPSTAADAALMLRIMSAGIIFTGAVNVLSSVLNALENFLLPAVSGMFITITTIIFIVFFSASRGAFVLAWGLLIGTFLQFLFLAPGALRRGFRYSPSLDLHRPEIRRSIKLALIFLAISFINGLNPAVNRLMASWLPAGSIAALAYADKLMQVPLIIFSGAIATSIFPYLSAQAAGGKLDELASTVQLGIRMAGFIFIPLAAVMMALGRPAIELLFQRGAFDAAATGLTSVIFVCYCLLLLSNYAAAILMRLMFAFQDYASMLKVVGVGLAANVVMNFAFMKLIDPPAAGIALSSSAGSLLAALLYYFTLKKRLPALDGKAMARPLLVMGLLSLPAGAAAFGTYALAAPAPGAGIAARSLALGVSAAAGLGIFAALAAALKLEEFMKVYNLAANRLKGKATSALS
jgi:putative peptidoglycan lipid II flippase